MASLVQPRVLSTEQQPVQKATRPLSAQQGMLPHSLHPSLGVGRLPGFRDAITFGAQEQQRTVLDIQLAHQQLLADMAELTTLYPQEKIQAGDQQRRPPIEVWDHVTSNGTLLAGVDIPNMVNAVAALEPSFQKLFYQGDSLNPQDPLWQKYQHVVKMIEGETPLIRPEYFGDLKNQGLGTTEALTSIELTKQQSVGVATFLGVSSGLAAHTIAKLGTKAQQAFWLGALNNGIMSYAFGLTEKDAGSDPRSIQTKWRREGEHYVINGNKKFIGNVAPVKDPTTDEVIWPGADFIVVFAVDDPNKPPELRQFRAFMVPRQAIGEEHIRPTGGEQGKMGLNEVNNGDFDLKEVRVPAAAVLGDPDENIYKTLMEVLDETRLLVAGQGVGTAEAVLEEAEDYATRRNQNGVSIWQYQGVRFPIERLKAKSLVARLWVLDTARQLDEIKKAEQEKEGKLAQATMENEADTSAKKAKKKLIRTEGAIGKLFATELAEDAVRVAINTLGGRGYLENEEGRWLSKRARDAKVLTIYEGTSNIQRYLILEGIVREELKKMKKDFGYGVRMGLLMKIPMSRSLSSVLSSTRFSPPVDRAEALYRAAVAGLMNELDKSRKEVKAHWERGNAPDAFKSWQQKDPDSFDRQIKMTASIPYQYRAFLVVEMAMNAKLAKLAFETVDKIKTHPSGNKALDQNYIRYLNLFQEIAAEENQNLATQLASGATSMLQSDFYQDPKGIPV